MTASYRPIFEWNWDNGGFVRVSADPTTPIGEILDMLDQLIAIKRAELVKRAKEAADGR